MAEEKMTLVECLRNPMWVTPGDMPSSLARAEMLEDMDAAADRIERLETALKKIQEPITVAADADTVSACQDLHELICDIARAALEDNTNG